MKIKCPSNSFSKEERIKKIYTYFDEWIRSDEMIALVNITGGEFKEDNFLNLFDTLFKYSRRWDFRALQSNGGERWKINDNDVYDEMSDEIIKIASDMGLEGETRVEHSPDYILILGGARMSNFTRCYLAKGIYERFDRRAKAIIALSGLRLLNEIELPYIEKYASGAKTEFDAISMAMESFFSLDPHRIEENRFDSSNENFSWVKRKYYQKSNTKFVSLAAPSTDGSRRANSFDTFDFFLKSEPVDYDDKILAVTSSIYVPYQTIRFMPLALERNLNIEFAGGAAGAFNKASNYCQEIKATFDAIKMFMELYPYEIYK